MSVSPLPTPVPQTSDPDNFNPRADALMTALPTFVTEVNALQVDVNSKQVLAATSATNAATSETNASNSASIANAAATTASSAASAVLWVSGASVAQYAVVISPANKQSYRRITATGSGTTDPSLDSTNYTRLSGPGIVLLSTITPTASQYVSALNVFTSDYDDYRIVIEGIDIVSGSGLSLDLRLANSGAADTSSQYWVTNSAANLISLGGATSGAKGLSGFFEICNVNSSTKVKTLNLATAAFSGSSVSSATGPAAYVGNTVSGFRLEWRTGVNFIATGTIRVYGYPKT